MSSLNSWVNLARLRGVPDLLTNRVVVLGCARMGWQNLTCTSTSCCRLWGRKNCTGLWLNLLGRGGGSE